MSNCIYFEHYKWAVRTVLKFKSSNLAQALLIMVMGVILLFFYTHCSELQGVLN